ncbi:hypothetical protein EUX98_g2592 [Antrodiella citrinella]|uniref:N-acetyltransferase domain-containing protein n=1 Tax=Antrodiella citrinella TaxID=2447956 RepID=A0A4S4N017_9APHY|nr:hypothetical protein EUX98_g2592 [Antrodiella citrinella]
MSDLTEAKEHPFRLNPVNKKISVEQTLNLRHSVLWPDKPISYVRLPEDDAGHHYGAFLSPNDTTPIAVLSVFLEALPTLDDDPAFHDLASATVPAARFRKFACDPTWQGQGVGTVLLRDAFDAARLELGCRVTWCDARLATKAWYERRGMRSFGSTFFKDVYIEMDDGDRVFMERTCAYGSPRPTK